MKKAAVVVSTYNPTESNYNNILALKELFDSGFDIYVINNNSTYLDYIEKIKQIDFINFEDSDYGGAYEAGSLYQVFKKDLYETYMLLQDSMHIKLTAIFYDYATNDYPNILCLIGFDSCLDSFISSKDRVWFDEIFPDLIDELKMTPGILGNNFLCKRRHLIQMSRIGYFREEKLPKNKDGSQAWERVWATYFSKYKIPVRYIDNLGNGMNNQIFHKILQNRI